MLKASITSNNIKDHINGVYEIHRPANNDAWVIFDSPHSGREYPENFHYKLTDEQMHEAEDSFIDDIFECVPESGGVLLRALFPRTYIDPNRNEDDITKNMLADPQNWTLGFNPTLKSKWGHGLIRESLHHLRAYIYQDNNHPTAREVTARIETYHRPYHKALKALIDESSNKHGNVWHVNCHSMPSHCVSDAQNIDFCIGDDFGKSCAAPEFTDIVHEWLQDRGYAVSINAPFSGGRLVQDYTSPAAGRHSLQIEINKALYWDENKNRPNTDYARVKSDMTALSGYIVDFTGAQLMPVAVSE